MIVLDIFNAEAEGSDLKDETFDESECEGLI